MVKFDSIETPDKLTMIRYFWEDFKPSIKVEIEQQDQATTNFKEIISKAVNRETKEGLKFSTVGWNLDACCFKGYRLSHNTFSKMQTQVSNNKDSFRSEEPKPKDLKPVSPRNNVAAVPAKKKDRKEKKKKFRRQRREHIGEQKKQTPATGVNEAVLKKKQKVRCFNCDKKGYYQMIVSNLQKMRVGFGNLRADDWW